MLSKDSIELWSTRRTFADTALLATTTVALMASLVVAATVVSIGIARADAFGAFAGNGVGQTSSLGPLLAAMNGPTATSVQATERERGEQHSRPQSPHYRCCSASRSRIGFHCCC